MDEEVCETWGSGLIQIVVFLGGAHKPVGTSTDALLIVSVFRLLGSRDPRHLVSWPLLRSEGHPE